MQALLDVLERTVVDLQGNPKDEALRAAHGEALLHWCEALHAVATDAPLDTAEDGAFAFVCWCWYR